MLAMIEDILFLAVWNVSHENVKIPVKWAFRFIKIMN